jgi:SOS-response transcriptional repressor LexA|uniref:Repressor protein CI n=1 Tax=Myoviridae sp. ctZ2t4 TaxID=2827693 RepID=A0A8S5SS36_9CAUD|nr:MAG TPA: Repressor protein CI [Myoviridae sp. ctZ2t4]
MKKTGETLKKIRKKNKITGEQLAELLDCSTQFIYSIESNKSKFPIKKLELIKNFINENDYSELLDAIKLDNESPILKEEKLKIKYIGQIKQKKIPFFPDIQASAGYGCLNEDETELEFIEVPEELAKPGNIAIRVFGESMEPEIKDGDTIVIETKCVECIKNKIIVVNYQGAVYLKKFVEEGNTCYLVSINPYYPRIKVLDKAELKVIGKLKGVMRYY